MNKVILLFMCIYSSLIFAQIKQTTINGKTYNVYPLQAEVEGNSRSMYRYLDFKEQIKRDEKNREIISSEIVEITAEDRFYKEKRKMSKQDKVGLEYIEKNQVILARPSFNILRKDPTPCIENLPDGEYVQFFRDLPYISNNTIRYKNDVVAAIFTIKNNLLNGEAVFYDFREPVIIGKGNYLNGLKTGEWSINEYEFESPEFEMIKFDKKPVLVLKGKAKYTFVEGLKTGEYSLYKGDVLFEKGEFIENVPSGHWVKYQYKQIVDSVYIKKYKVYETFTRDSDEIIKKAEYTYRADKTPRKGILLRNEIVPYEIMYESMMADTLNFDDLYGNYDERGSFENWGDFYQLKIQKEEDDLAEEGLSSYGGDEDFRELNFYEGDYYRNREDTTYVEGENYVFENGKRYTLNEYIDSAGYIYLYEGIAEQYFPNGQLQFRFEVKDGVLQKETPVYWSNGTIANEILFDENSKTFVQTFYDYDGKKYLTNTYNEKGNLIKKPIVVEENLILIDGKNYINQDEYPTYFWDWKREDSLTSESVIAHEIFKLTKGEAVTVTLNPVDYTRKNVVKDLAGNVFKEVNAQYTSDYFSVTEEEKIKVENFEIKTTGSGSASEYIKMRYKDDNPQILGASSYSFNMTYDQTYFVDNAPFNGQFNIKANQKHLKFKASPSKVIYYLPTVENDLKDYNKAVKNFLKSGKQNDVIHFYLSDFNKSGTLSGALLNELGFTYGQFDMRVAQNYDYGTPRVTYDFDDYLYYDEEPGRRKKRKNQNLKSYNKTLPKSLSVNFKNGKPEGRMTIYDGMGKVAVSVEFINGQENGELRSYEWIMPKPKLPKRNAEIDYMSYQMERTMNMPDSLFPKKPTNYLSYLSNYKNGRREGYAYSFGWKGDTISSYFYKDGMAEGKGFERNAYFYQESNFEFGAYDGVQRTYLLKQNSSDSILLFELNFQDGVLQGESKSFHSNGNVAKKGFFLNGQPIDDYEAYDTLGFKYQYVKFQFNQPVQEKIWEENKLSVLYEFDWRDSIFFDVEDIVSVSSIDNLTRKYGFENDYYLEPYYGRPSVLNKSGVDYALTKYYPNDVIARTGQISKGKKVGCWNYYSYEGLKLMEVDYFDTLIVINDSTRFNSKGILSYVDKTGNVISKSYIIEKIEKYDCAHTDHNEERLLYCFWDKNPNQERINGYVKNYYDNGSLMNEGMVKNGLPTGIWKMYDSDGNLSRVGQYINGKRDGRWLEGDLGSVKNMSEICLNPNLENLEEILKYQENLLDISVIYYKYGKEKIRTFYGINQNNGEAPDGYEEEYYEGEYEMEGY